MRATFSFWCWVNIPDGAGFAASGYVEVDYKNMIEAEGKVREYITSLHGPNFTDAEIYKAY